MEQEIRNMIASLESGVYDPEGMHWDYEKLLEQFILKFDEDLVPLMEKLISIEKEFWYA